MRPTRETTRENDSAYFVSTQTAGRKPFFRHDRWARLMLGTINHYRETGYHLHAFVIMPDHLHLLITPVESVEKSVQLIKGGFSFRARKELVWSVEIWQPGFTDHRIRDEEDWSRHLQYIASNPIEARLAEDIALYEFIGFPSMEFPRGLKPAGVAAPDVRAEASTLLLELHTLQPEAGTLQPEACFPSMEFPRGLKPAGVAASDVRAEARTLLPEACAFQPDACALQLDARTVQPEARAVQPEARALQPEAGALQPDTKSPTHSKKKNAT